jgi:hypothetical protein
MNRTWLALLALAVGTVAGWCGSASAVAAATVALPVSQVFDAEPQTSDNVFSYELTAETAGSPMPTSADIYSFTMAGTQAITLPPLLFDQIGVYHYSLRGTSDFCDGYVLDPQVFTIAIYVTNEATPITVAYLKDGYKASALSFTQFYRGSPVLEPLPPGLSVPEQEVSPPPSHDYLIHTGGQLIMTKWGGVVLGWGLSVVGLALIVIYLVRTRIHRSLAPTRSRVEPIVDCHTAPAERHPLTDRG